MTCDWSANRFRICMTQPGNRFCNQDPSKIRSRRRVGLQAISTAKFPNELMANSNG